MHIGKCVNITSPRLCQGIIKFADTEHLVFKVYVRQFQVFLSKVNEMDSNRVFFESIVNKENSAKIMPKWVAIFILSVDLLDISYLTLTPTALPLLPCLHYANVGHFNGG